MKHKTLLRFIVSIAIVSAGYIQLSASDPMETKYSFSECCGSLSPYPSEEIRQIEYPDSLSPVFINYVGRHGSRFPASSLYAKTLRGILEKAESLGTLTTKGKSLLKITDMVLSLSEDRWGALDSVGETEMRGLAARMYLEFGEVFSGNNVSIKGMSSYSPRAMMSMNCFLHQIDRMNNNIEFSTTTGRINSILLRPFDVDKEYKEYISGDEWRSVYESEFNARCPLSAIERVVGKDFPFESEDEARTIALYEYYVIAGLESMGLPSEMKTFFTEKEANSLWSLFNLRQYLRFSASTLSTSPEEMASPLVLNLIETTDRYVTGEDTNTRGIFRFGHAETLMPLLSLLKIPGCRYLTNYFDSVARSWRDFDIVPMAANFRIIIFKAQKSGRFYVRLDLNEKPVLLRQGDEATIYPWGEVRRYMMNCIPIYRSL